MVKEFNVRFWTGTCAAAVICFGTVAVATVLTSASNPPKPAFPLSGTSLPVGLCVGHSGHADHYAFRFGLFGVGDRIKNADVLIVGSSHAIFGLSAERIAAALSERWGRRGERIQHVTGIRGWYRICPRDSPEQQAAG